MLAKCLRDLPTTAAALGAFEELRRVVAYSRSVGSSKALSRPLARFWRDLSLPLALKLFANPTSLRWLYDYRIAWEPPLTARSSPPS